MDPLPLSPAPASKRPLLLGALLAVLALLGLFDWWYERHKEARYDAEILQVAAQHGVEPSLVKAVVWRESKFNPRVRGRVGEIGLMQIRNITAAEWAKAVRRQTAFEGDLFHPPTNLEVGTWYLSKLLRRYTRTDNPVPYALADYNAGRSNVLRWNLGRAETNSEAFTAQISFPGTQEYVRSIQKRALKYRNTFVQK
jgi:soluble lytic murein transglycosylase